MPGIEITFLVVILSVFPTYITGGLLVTWTSNHFATEEESGVILEDDSPQDEFTESGGYVPSILGAVGGIASGVLLETLVIFGMAVVTIFSGTMGFGEFIVGSAFGVLIAMSLAITRATEIESDVRKSRWYRGWS